MSGLTGLPGTCMLAGLGLAIGPESAAQRGRVGLHTGPIHVDIAASADVVYRMMASFDEQGGEATRTIERREDGAVVRDFVTHLRLPLGLTPSVRTREEIRLLPPGTLAFRHLAGPVRGMTETITVVADGPGRSRVTYAGRLPQAGLLLRIAHRLIARPAIERIVRTHLADLSQRAETSGDAA